MAQAATKVLTAQVPILPAEKVDQEQERSRLTREALAEVDAGQVIDHQAVQAWAGSLSTTEALPIRR
ncbi:CopG family transcriptional regulator [uncultured Thiodictyon sp.]|uniref:CopG family transcriptional regulator n=1 Tax=uncultured Thiodictyon sp. TaxID=1846217 RepID=UPI0025E9EAAE|nr:CopG family transcriptional regulator [uncultured Thiodictyon sp.]